MIGNVWKCLEFLAHHATHARLFAFCSLTANLASLKLGCEAKEKIDQYTRPDEGLETPGLEELPGSKRCDIEMR